MSIEHISPLLQAQSGIQGACSDHPDQFRGRGLQEVAAAARVPRVQGHAEHAAPSLTTTATTATTTTAATSQTQCARQTKEYSIHKEEA